MRIGHHGPVLPGDIERPARLILALLASPALITALPSSALADGHPEARNIHELGWKKPHIAHVYAVGYTELGTGANQSDARVAQVGERSCVVGNGIGFDVEDVYAFDIDEPVKLTVTYLPIMTSNPINVVWDKSGGDGHGLTTIRTEGEGFQQATVTLDRARFSGQGARQIDFALSAPRKGQIAVCDVTVERSGTTRRAERFGSIELLLQDAETGAAIPARVGIYDETGRAPLPSEDSLVVQRFGDKVRLVSINQRTPWPTDNRVGFYALGDYRARLPAGKYQIAVSRGPEYRMALRTIAVKPGKAPTKLTIALSRYDDMPRRGWISGDDHVHLQREEIADPNVWLNTAAEDIHVANLLQMGNIAGTYFEQPAWDEAGRYTFQGRSLVSGQEDPRTGQLGHTIHENLKAPLHLPSNQYFVYNKMFEASRAQGGISGFAHLGDWFHAQRGLAIAVPFGEVDFIEMCEAGLIAVDTWYDLLNMGFKIAPSAGSDWPYTDLPGVSRLYVKSSGKARDGGGLDDFFAQWKAGHVFVTNGPFLDFTVNGQPMGSELRAAKGDVLHIRAEVRLNPDIDKLDRLDLVSQGDVLVSKKADGTDRIVLEADIPADASKWLAVRAYGKRQEPGSTVGAHSAPVYVVVDGKPFWKTSALPALIAHQQDVLNEILTGPLLSDEDLENYETNDILVAEWPKQREVLRPRIMEASRRYADILKAAFPGATP